MRSDNQASVSRAKAYSYVRFSTRNKHAGIPCTVKPRGLGAMRPQGAWSSTKALRFATKASQPTTAETPR
jgi:hypothetical protein